MAHRVENIHARTDIFEWGHVKGIENPVDIISKDFRPNDLSKCMRSLVARSRLVTHGTTILAGN